MIKKGDTLIEVTLAVGIFSMIAVAIVAVMSNGVANAQTALEATLTREEIDTQAEALRFIHASYISSIDYSSENRYAALWKEITRNAINLEPDGSNETILQYTPNNCNEDLYGREAINTNNYFIINPRNLGNNDANTDDIVITNNGDTSIFQPAATYPRLVYGSNGLQELSTQNRQDSLFRAEGIFILAVKDENTTITGSEGSRGAAFYDFYIRTCWYGNRSSDASTISTVIRLYDPNFVSNPSNP